MFCVIASRVTQCNTFDPLMDKHIGIEVLALLSVTYNFPSFLWNS